MEQRPAVTPERITQFAWGYAPPLIMEAALRRGVFDQLEAGPKSLDEMVTATGASERGLKAIMNALVGLGLLGKAGKGYELTPESATFLVRGKPSYLGGLIMHTSNQLIPQFLRINEAVETGKPATAVNDESMGSPFFQELVSNIFPLSYAPARALAAHLDFGESGSQVRLLDLAAGSGVWSIAVAQSSPRVHVTAVDWAGVLPVAERTVAKFGLTERYAFIAGDLGSADFGSGHNLAILGHILHSEGEERSRSLLKKTYDALAPGGTIAIAEFLVNEDRTGPPMGLIFAVNMLVHTEHGETYSFEQISEWLSEAGFKDPTQVEAPGPSPLILATKP